MSVYTETKENNEIFKETRAGKRHDWICWGQARKGRAYQTRRENGIIRYEDVYGRTQEKT